MEGRNPATGEFMEYPLTPRILREELARCGLSSSLASPIFPPFVGVKGSVKFLIHELYSLFPSFTIFTSPTFVLLGRKSG